MFEATLRPTDPGAMSRLVASTAIVAILAGFGAVAAAVIWGVRMLLLWVWALVFGAPPVPGPTYVAVAVEPVLEQPVAEAIPAQGGGNTVEPHELLADGPPEAIDPTPQPAPIRRKRAPRAGKALLLARLLSTTGGSSVGSLTDVLTDSGQAGKLVSGLSSAQVQDVARADTAVRLLPASERDGADLAASTPRLAASVSERCRVVVLGSRVRASGCSLPRDATAAVRIARRAHEDGTLTVLLVGRE